jgi:hypothetical protein
MWMMNVGHKADMIAVVTALLMTWRRIAQQNFLKSSANLIDWAR